MQCLCHVSCYDLRSPNKNKSSVNTLFFPLTLSLNLTLFSRPGRLSYRPHGSEWQCWPSWQSFPAVCPPDEVGTSQCAIPMSSPLSNPGGGVCFQNCNSKQNYEKQDDQRPNIHWPNDSHSKQETTVSHEPHQSQWSIFFKHWLKQSLLPCAAKYHLFSI